MKTLVIDAICGVGLPTFSIATEAERKGFAHYTGTQHHQRWTWNRSRLEEQELEVLQSLYTNLRIARDDDLAEHNPQWAKNLVIGAASAH